MLALPMIASFAEQIMTNGNRNERPFGGVKSAFALEG
jgi:hypothetical protein